jgi:hypothetical protein
MSRSISSGDAVTRERRDGVGADIGVQRQRAALALLLDPCLSRRINPMLAVTVKMCEDANRVRAHLGHNPVFCSIPVPVSARF